MSAELVQLGAVELIQLGKLRFIDEPSKPSSSPVVELFRIVDYMENPSAGIEIEPGEPVSPRQRAIAEQIHTKSRIIRKNLAKEVGLRGYSYKEAMSEVVRLASVLNEMGVESISLGKFKVGKKTKKVAKKVVKVVKSPAFLSVVGVAANLIPGAGQAASAALLTTAGVSAKRQQEKKKKKALKKEQAAAARQAAQQDEEALDAYYAQYHVEHLDPLGYTPDVWRKFSRAKKRQTLEKLADGTLEPYVSEEEAKRIAVTNTNARQQVVQAAALSRAMKNVYGDSLPGEPVQVPSDLEPEVNEAASQYEKQILSVGKENFLATAMKAVGQGGAINALYEGLGTELPEGMGDVFEKVKDSDAIFNAGVQDLLNSAAFTGSQEVIQQALSQSTSEFPWTTVGISALGVALIAGIVIAAKSA
jgi:hypothetical protein